MILDPLLYSSQSLVRESNQMILEIKARKNHQLMKRQTEISSLTHKDIHSIDMRKEKQLNSKEQEEEYIT